MCALRCRGLCSVVALVLVSSTAVRDARRFTKIYQDDVLARARKRNGKFAHQAPGLLLLQHHPGAYLARVDGLQKNGVLQSADVDVNTSARAEALESFRRLKSSRQLRAKMLKANRHPYHKVRYQAHHHPVHRTVVADRDTVKAGGVERMDQTLYATTNSADQLTNSTPSVSISTNISNLAKPVLHVSMNKSSVTDVINAFKVSTPKDRSIQAVSGSDERESPYFWSHGHAPLESERMGIESVKGGAQIPSHNMELASGIHLAKSASQIVRGSVSGSHSHVQSEPALQSHSPRSVSKMEDKSSHYPSPKLKRIRHMYRKMAHGAGSDSVSAAVEPHQSARVLGSPNQQLEIWGSKQMTQASNKMKEPVQVGAHTLDGNFTPTLSHVAVNQTGRIQSKPSSKSALRKRLIYSRETSHDHVPQDSWRMMNASRSPTQSRQASRVAGEQLSASSLHDLHTPVRGVGPIWHVPVRQDRAFPASAKHSGPASSGNVSKGPLWSMNAGRRHDHKNPHWAQLRNGTEFAAGGHNAELPIQVVSDSQKVDSKSQGYGKPVTSPVVEQNSGSNKSEVPWQGAVYQAHPVKGHALSKPPMTASSNDSGQTWIHKMKEDILVNTSGRAPPLDVNITEPKRHGRVPLHIQDHAYNFSAHTSRMKPQGTFQRAFDNATEHPFQVTSVHEGQHLERTDMERNATSLEIPLYLRWTPGRSFGNVGGAHSFRMLPIFLFPCIFLGALSFGCCLMWLMAPCKGCLPKIRKVPLCQVQCPDIVEARPLGAWSREPRAPRPWRSGVRMWRAPVDIVL